MNALDAAMVEAIVAAGNQVGDDSSVRAVVLSWDLAALPEAVGAPLVSSGGQATAHAS